MPNGVLTKVCWRRTTFLTIWNYCVSIERTSKPKVLRLPNLKKAYQIKDNQWCWTLVVDGTAATLEPVRLQFCQVWTNAEDLFVQLLEE